MGEVFEILGDEFPVFGGYALLVGSADIGVEGGFDEIPIFGGDAEAGETLSESA